MTVSNSVSVYVKSFFDNGFSQPHKIRDAMAARAIIFFIFI